MSHKVFDLIKTMSGYGRKRLSYNVSGQYVEIGLPVPFFKRFIFYTSFLIHFFNLFYIPLYW